MQRFPGNAFLRWSIPAIICLLLSACVTVDRAMPTGCHIIYDAGSSATRLYAYQQTNNGWSSYTGPSSSALSDPLRTIRGKTPDQMQAVVAEMLESLQELRLSDQFTCDIKEVSVLATAGMRIAEREFPAASRELWATVERVFAERMNLAVTGRTISGFEEGLYAWMAEREQQTSDDFGLVEMGGASFQLSFPCELCATSRSVLIAGRPVKMVSRSFNGWGQDEAWARHGGGPACASVPGKERPGWQAKDCLGNLAPLNQLISTAEADMRVSGVTSWHTTGAFKYSRPDDVERYCVLGKVSSYQPESACFRAAYLQTVVEMLGLDAGVQSTDAEWSLGAAICAATQCLDIR